MEDAYRQAFYSGVSPLGYQAIAGTITGQYLNQFGPAGLEALYGMSMAGPTPAAFGELSRILGGAYTDVTGPEGLRSLYAQTLASGAPAAALGEITRALGGQYLDITGPEGLRRSYYEALASGIPEASLEQWRRTVSGEFLGGANEYLRQIEEGIKDQVTDLMGRYEQQLAAAGQGVGTPLAALQARTAAQLAGELGRLRYGAYESERERMERAAREGAAFAPELAERMARLYEAERSRMLPYAQLGVGLTRDVLGDLARLYEAERARAIPAIQIATGLPADVAGDLARLYEAERGRMLAAAQFGVGALPEAALRLFQAGALPRSLQQQEIDRAYQEMLRLWNETYRAAGMYNPFQSVGQTSTQYGPSPFASILGAIAPVFLPKP